MKVKVAQSCLTLCDPMDYKVHGILQARILEWAAFPFSRGSSQPRDRTQVSRIAGGFFTSWVTRDTLKTRHPEKNYFSGCQLPNSVCIWHSFIFIILKLTMFCLSFLNNSYIFYVVFNTFHLNFSVIPWVKCTDDKK